jgi:predicted nucleotidyltransferase
MNAEIARNLPEIETLCRRYGVVLLELFGSAAGPKFDESSSDFDFVATFSETGPGTDYGWRYLEFAIALERLLGRPVDVITPESIQSPHFKSAVDATRQTIHAANARQAIA